MDALPSLDEVVRWYVGQHVALKRPSSRKTIGWICGWWARELPSHPTPAEIHRKASELVQAGQLCAITANMRLGILSRCYEVARTRWPMLPNAAHRAHCPKLPTPVLEVRGLLQPDETWPRVLAVLPGPEGKCFAALQRRNGLRVGEARGLGPEHVLWGSEEIFVRQHRESDQSKPGPLKADTAAARLPMHPEVKMLLREVMAARMRKPPEGALAGYLFPLWRCDQDALLRRMRDVAPGDFPTRIQGERGANAWHVLRHTYGTELVEAGMPLHEVQLAMRHASLATTQGYVASIRGRRVPSASLRAMWAAKAERTTEATEQGFTLDMKQVPPSVSRLAVPQGEKD